MMPSILIARNQASGQNLVDSTKIARIVNDSKTSLPKEKKDKERRKQKKEKREKSHKHSSKKSTKSPGVSEKSGVTEELDGPQNHLGYLSDGSQNSNKRKRDCSPPAVESVVKVVPVAGKPLRIRLTFKKPKVESPLPREDVVTCSTSGAESLNQAPRAPAVCSSVCEPELNVPSTSETKKICEPEVNVPCNFTTLIGQGAFGPVYKAQMSTGETVAVKVLATDSKQGEKEFQTEVMLLGRLHHRNLVNLVGYCAEKGQHMLIYVYMSKGSLASHLYSDKHEPLSWDLRIYIALDVARGLEYLHDGAVPPVIHRDIKSSNILLDQSMRARVADFGLSREEMVNKHAANVRGTFGYLDPEYISTRTFTKKSDVYGFGVLLFELIAARNPQQGLMEYVELAAMNAEEKVGWEEIVDSRLDGRFDLQEVNEVAALAYKCISRAPRKRPNMRDVVQVLARVVKVRHSRKRQKMSSSPYPCLPTVESSGEQTGNRSVRSENYRRDNSMESSIVED